MNEHDIEQFLSQDGFLKQELSSFEERASQKQLACFINDCVHRETSALCEAGTGIGKTLAYLIPLLVHAIESGERSVISTETIALQDQLYKKDIPLLSRIIRKHYKKNISVVLALGSTNYLCTARYHTMRGSLEKNEKALVDEIDNLLSRKKIFSRLDLTCKTRSWDSICRDADLCRGNRCALYQSCTFQLARKAWFDSNIIITNHSLFFSNITLDKKYLPQFDIALFDEAHSTPEICRRQNGFHVHRTMIDKNELILRESVFFRKRTKPANTLRKTITRARGDLSDFFETYNHRPGRVLSPLHEAGTALNSCEELYRICDKKLYDTDESDALYLESFKNAIFNIIQSLQMLIRIPDGWVIWCEREGASFSYTGEPLLAAEIFRENIYPFYKSVFFISATLTVGNSFDFFEERCGISDYQKINIGTEFDYRKNAILYLPPMPVPSDGNFIQKAVVEIERLVKLSSGKTLILFNSYDMLKKVTELSDIRHPLISQLEYSAFEAVSLFRQTEDAVLMGTHSFWQGIDIAGEALSNLIIMRLPFSPPDRPDIEALCETFEDPMEAFMKVQLPVAVLKFRQGFGRLIRSKSDTGIITILDNRITARRYGKLFLESVPPVTLTSQFDTVVQFYALVSKKHDEQNDGCDRTH